MPIPDLCFRVPEVTDEVTASLTDGVGDGCGGKTITTAAQSEPERHGFEGKLGFVDSKKGLQTTPESISLRLSQHKTSNLL